MFAPLRATEKKNRHNKDDDNDNDADDSNEGGLNAGGGGRGVRRARDKLMLCLVLLNLEKLLIYDRIRRSHCIYTQSIHLAAIPNTKFGLFKKKKEEN